MNEGDRGISSLRRRDPCMAVRPSVRLAVGQLRGRMDGSMDHGHGKGRIVFHVQVSVYFY